MENIKLENVEKVVMLADLHFGKHSTKEWQDTIKDYYKSFFLPLLKNVQTSGGYDSKCVLIAGDVFDNRTHLDISVMNDAIDIIGEMSEICPVVIDTGNHDIYKTNETDITSLAAFKFMKNVYILGELTTLTLSNEKSFLIIPWVGDTKKETEIIRKNKKLCDIIITHTEISGMKFNKTTDIINGVDLTTVGKKIYSGHIHLRQESKKCTYLGSPYQLDRNDMGNEKGVYILTIGSTIKEDFIQNNLSPKFIQIELNVSDPSIHQTDVRNNYVDIIYDRSRKSDVNIQKITDMFINEFEARSVKFIERDDLKVDTHTEIKNININTDIVNVFESTVDKTRLTEDDFKELQKLNEYYITKAQKGDNA